MSRCQATGVPSSVGFPRVSGDEPSRMCFFEWSAEFSPRERG